ncbi:feruloyl-CoA synthase [Variovorax sp. J22P168]|uniref:feruloyl-CoA synthase n=1 Tax=Variovorax jilinensis TaxID=3053513 RepID=UPI002578FA27|nr:feruloyl-CoA synthase [Variovorax sp. J22P168]MDM0015282.1 feruloyl-CoA synthase [Variovorax sp. J22P168]
MHPTIPTPASGAHGYRPTPFPRRKAVCERRADGTLILRNVATPPEPQHIGFAGYVPQWAARRPETNAFCERDAHGQWRCLTWAELWEQVQRIGSAILQMGLGPGRPLMVLSANSLEHLQLMLAAEFVGVPFAAVSPAYSLLSRDLVRLAGVCELVPPAAVFVQDVQPFSRALGSPALAGLPVIAVNNAIDGQTTWQSLVQAPLSPKRRDAVLQAHRDIEAADVARVLFTSGSTGVPKGVPISYGNLQGTAANLLDMFGMLQETQTVFLDWLPWHHALGGVLNLGRSLLLGATHYIDDGKPLPGMFDRTVRNLREVSPTLLTSVPAAWTMLAAELERDPQLARSVFSRVLNFGYGGASLPSGVNERIQRVAERTVGERIMFATGLASTETAGVGTYRMWASEDLANIGMPAPGTEIKLVPLEDGARYEIRVRGPHNFAGYIGRPDLTAAAFDEERFFRLGDAVRLVDASDPTQGLHFDGRVGEDFKLVSGTWVRTGAVRLALVERCAPLISDAVICGHDRDYVAALAWPNVAACQQLAPELANLDAAALVKHPLLLAALRERLGGNDGHSSLAVERVLLMDEPPSMDANEIADKGYVNQAATRTRRAHLVRELYSEPVPEHLACAH